MDESSIEHLLVAHADVEAQHDAAIDDRLMNLYDQVAQELMNIRQSETPFLKQRSQLLVKICAYLETDACCLLPTLQFRQFLEILLSACQARSRVVRPAPLFSLETTDWLLKRFNFPLQLRQYEVFRGQVHVFRMTASLSSWQQTFTITIARSTLESGGMDFLEADKQWVEILDQMRLGSFSTHITGQEVRPRLAQEIACLLCYVGSLLELTPKMRWFAYP